MRYLLLLAAIAPLAGAYACATSNSSDRPPVGGASSGAEAGTGGGTSTGGGSGAEAGTGGGSTGFLDDGGTGDGAFDPDSACATALAEARTEQLPVDIVWMVDNSPSMEPAVAEVKQGLNDFAARIAASALDYRVIMLSYRSKTSPVTVGGDDLYPVCIPPPLAGDGSCGNGERFFHSSVNIRSTQPLEQLLGTLGQTAGYREGDARGGEPWREQLRPEATKTLVLVTDDNSRLTADQFERFAGGRTPGSSSTSLMLPPGILDPHWNGLFEGYVFSAIYGWGLESDPEVTCVYSDGSTPPSPGPTYTELVARTDGVRARVCDGHAAWEPFFAAVAQAVVRSSRLSCELDIPEPSGGATLDPDAVNVRIADSGAEEVLFRVDGAEGCGPDGGWYYDDPARPEHVVLCQASCDRAQAVVGPGKAGRIEVLFGCTTITQ
ncbi:uncharacterized protein SOCE26_085420 [Sorangium cellulosum]|uniref:VWFA domain-containing protein n=1 Tax=Sorangium cellulosum TaxID=56 RepID=A0A2L0F6A4_SORCE|nr:VWA domain-containing protein [Sorangium cellulosum]AUX47031.1 uncharacterized protein SOCE26_085420 [Sorangium cellulosum]